jgi:GNAT superfamily N-acetyltransferase
MTLTLRAAGPAHAEEVATLITRAYRVEDFFVHGDRTNADDVRARMAKGQFLVLEDSTRTMVGCVYVEARGDRGYFGMLSIDPAHQRKGLGTQLVAAAEEYCRNAGCRRVDIEVVNIRSELPPFYHGLGYRKCGIRPFPDIERPKLPCHFVVMTRSLQPRER